MKRRMCPVCGKPVKGRSDKRCCSESCKKKLLRREDRLEQLLINLQSIIRGKN